jgi:hypothetical protein
LVQVAGVILRIRSRAQNPDKDEVTLAGLPVIVAAAFDAAEARSLGERGTPLPAGERLVLAGVVLVAAVLVASVLIAGPMPGTLIVAPILLGLVVYLGLRQRRRTA